MTSGKLHTEDPQILGTITQNWVAIVTWCPGFVHPCSNSKPDSYVKQNIVAIIWFYSKIPLVWHPWGQTGVGLSNIPVMEQHPYWPKALTGNFLLLLLYQSCRNNQSIVLFGYLLQLLVQACQGHLCSLQSAVSARDSEGPGDCGSRVFIVEDDDGLGDKGSADTRTVSVKDALGWLMELGLFPSNAE